MALAWIILAGAAWASDTHGGIAGTGLTVRLAPCESHSAPGESNLCIVAHKITGGSSAARAGIGKGDVILAVRPHALVPGYWNEGEHDATEDELALVQHLLEGPPGMFAEVVFRKDADSEPAWIERGTSRERPWCTVGDCEDGRGKVEIWDMSWDCWFEDGLPADDCTVRIWDGTYTGELNGWVPEGEGSFRDAQSALWTGTWTAEVWTGEYRPAEGQGTRLSANGDRYSGHWVGLQREGQGKEVRTDKTGWDGAWHEDAPLGRGTWVGADLAGRKGTYTGTLTGITDAGAPLFEGPVSRNFDLAGGAEYYSGCGRCLTASKKTQLTGMWTETGHWHEGVPVGPHVFAGPAHSLEAWDYGYPAPPAPPEP